jgi:Tfp pilus assembly protein PilO
MRTEKLIIYVLGGLLVVSVAFFLFSFAYTSLETMSAQNTQERLAELRENEKALGSDVKQWSEIDKTYAAFKENYLVKVEMFNQLKQELLNLSRKNGLGNANFSFKYKSMLSGILKLSVNVELVGSYENIKHLIFDIENFRMDNKIKIILLKRVQLNKMKAGTMVEGEISMEVYLAG